MGKAQKKPHETASSPAGQTTGRLFAAGQPPRRVLVVDDDPQIRRLVARFLGRFGYDVTQAENGQVGWRMFRERPHELVITDLQMPVLEGAALLARIKAMDGETPVVIITGQGREAVRHMVGVDGGAQARPPQAFHPRCAPEDRGGAGGDRSRVHRPRKLEAEPGGR